MTLQNLPQARIRHQNIAGPRKTAHNLVATLGALQAQDYNHALWAIGLRTGLTKNEVITAIERLEIVRTWSQRGTLHFVAAEDAKWMVDLSAPRRLAAAKTRHQELGLDTETLTQSKDLFATALEGQKRLTRPQMLELLERNGIPTQGQRGYHLLNYAAQTGLIYVGPMEAKQQTFGLLTDLPCQSPTFNEAESIAELTKRYFQSHGPATLADFVHWSGLTITQAKSGLAANQSHLNSETIEGKEYWFSATPTPKTSAPTAVLLPGFDEYILGYKDREAAVTPENFKRLVPGGNGIFMPCVVLDGQVTALWKATPKKDAVEISLQPFRPHSQKELASVEEAAHQYAKFLDLRLINCS